MTDFDGSEMSEKRLAREIRRSLHADLPVLSRDAPPAWPPKSRAEREVARGARAICCPTHFLAMFRFVRENAYEKNSLRDYLKAGT